MKLNSILLEGDVATLSTEDRATSVTTFTLKAENRKDNGTSKDYFGSCVFNIHCKGKLADILGHTLRKGSSIRVVGYLATTDDGSPFVFAEHIEIKPVSKNLPVAEAS